MEIENATTYTLSALTFDEKALAQGVLKSEQFRQSSSSVWLRAPSIDLVRDLTYMRQEARRRNFYAKNFRFYCDTLIVSEGATITPEIRDDNNKRVYFAIQLFARKIEAKAPLSVTLDDEDSSLSIMTPNIKDMLQLNFTLSNGETNSISPEVPDDKFGVEFELARSGKAVETKYRPVPQAGLELINYLDLINEDGTLKDKDYRNDDYPRLLQFQMLVAQAHAYVDTTLAIDLLKYVVAASHTKHGGYLNLQANTLLSSLLISDDVVAVPSVNIISSKTILKSRLVAAQAFETSFRTFQSSAGNMQMHAINALNMLARNKDVNQAYEFQRDLKQKDFDNAVKANAEASQALEDTNKSLEKLGNNFQDGIHAWVEKKKQKAKRDIIGKLFMAGLAIGATVLTGGAAAPLAAISISNVASAATSIAKLLKALKEFYDKVQALLKKLKPIIKKIKELVKIVQTVIATLKKFGSATGDVATTLRPKIDGKDPINATAEYDRFSVFIENLEAQVADYKDIAGKTEYFTALKIMVINGKAAIQAQANLIQKGDELAVIVVQKQVEMRDDKRLTAAATTAVRNKDVAELFTRAMFDRVLAIRGRVYLDFFTYMTAYQYHTLKEDRLFTLSPVKPVTDYLQDMTTLQGAIASFGSEVLVQKKPFIFTSLCGYNTSEELAQALQSAQGAFFTISPTEDIWQGFWRVRMGRVRCFLEGAKPSTQSSAVQTLRLELSTNGQFFDRTAQSLIPRSFVAEQRQIIFEYDSVTKDILCDGSYGQERDYTKHTPMTSWQIKIDNRSTDAMRASDVDFSEFTGVRLEFECEFAWLPLKISYARETNGDEDDVEDDVEEQNGAEAEVEEVED